MKLPSPVDRIGPDRLAADRGLGDSLSCFAVFAAEDWQEHIRPHLGDRKRRRLAWQTVANSAHVPAIYAVQIVRYMRRRKQ